MFMLWQVDVIERETKYVCKILGRQITGWMKRQVGKQEIKFIKCNLKISLSGQNARLTRWQIDEVLI